MTLRLCLSLLVGCLAVGCEAGELSPSDDSHASDDSGNAPVACQNPEAIPLQDGRESGYVRCADGAVDRVAAVALDRSLYLDAVPACSMPPHDGSSCQTDADCGESPWVRCANDRGSSTVTCSCVTLCAEDTDCGAGQACLAPEPAAGISWPTCREATCATDGDCASGECGLFSKSQGDWTLAGLACRTPGDACRTDADCGDSGEWTCAFVESADPAAWTCYPFIGPD
ncbi:MAG: hypothetical protein ABIO70_29020 [Pseudomonadota bacterium]